MNTEKKDERAQIKQCQNPIPLWTYETRKKSGETQVYCQTCKRWQFDKDVCPLFKAI